MLACHPTPRDTERRGGSGVLWRAWAFVAGLPVGAVAAFAAAPGLGANVLIAGCVLGGLALCAIVSLAAHLAAHEVERGRHLAVAASAGFLALPALAALLLGLGPGAWAWLAAALLLIALLVVRAARTSGPAGSAAAPLAAAALAVAAGTAGGLVAAGAWATLGATSAPPLPDRFATHTLHLDSLVAPLPAPACAARTESAEVLLDRGAHPRLASNGMLWFDAPGEDGRRQVHRLDRASGVVTCWTCQEPGENRRPAPGPEGRSVVFDTDRYASWLHPTNTEVHIALGVGDAPSQPSRRLTTTPGADDHGILDPSGRIVAWSRGAGGRYEVVAASMLTGHGGLILSRTQLLFSGGTRWTAPLAWSPDARALAVARGQPLAPREVRVIDPATGRVQRVLDVAPGSAISFSADGSASAVATARRGGAAGLLPGWLGFLVAPLTTAWGDESAPHLRAAHVAVGATWDVPAVVALDDFAGWGEPTGVALEADGRGFVLGQRRPGAESVEERLVSVRLACSGSAS